MRDRGLETTVDFHLHCLLFQSTRQFLSISIKKMHEIILKKRYGLVAKTLLYGDYQFNLPFNKSIISSTIEYIFSMQRFTQVKLSPWGVRCGAFM